MTEKQAKKQEESQLKAMLEKQPKLQFGFFKNGFMLLSVVRNEIVKGIVVYSITICNFMINTINHE